MQTKPNLVAWVLGSALLAGAVGALGLYSQAPATSRHSVVLTAVAMPPVRVPAPATPATPGAEEPSALADPQPAQASDAINVSFHEGHWVIHAQGMPRGQLAQQLARQSGTALSASLATMDQAAPAVLHTRARLLADAWRVVLGDEFSHALMCSAGRCRVWVTGLVPRSAPPVTTPLAEAGAERRNAQKDATQGAPLSTAVVQPRITSDPPGLFPSQPASGDDKANAAT